MDINKIKLIYDEVTKVSKDTFVVLHKNEYGLYVDDVTQEIKFKYTDYGVLADGLIAMKGLSLIDVYDKGIKIKSIYTVSGSEKVLIELRNCYNKSHIDSIDNNLYTNIDTCISASKTQLSMGLYKFAIKYGNGFHEEILNENFKTIIPYNSAYVPLKQWKNNTICCKKKLLSTHCKLYDEAINRFGHTDYIIIDREGNVIDAYTQKQFEADNKELYCGTY